MSRRESFDDALDAALDALREGEPLDAVLAAHARYATDLRPLLETAVRASASRIHVPASSVAELAANITIVRAALQRAQLAEQPTPAAVAAPATSWWRRRVTIASLSLPAGLFALLAAAGVAAAAAGTVAVTTSTDLTSRIQDAVSGGGSSASPETKPGGANVNHTPPGVAAAETARASQTASPNRPTLTTVVGIISLVHGGTFTLTSADGEWKVDTDANTVVTGTITEGAAATATGDVTAEKNLHAQTIEIGAAAPADLRTPTSARPDEPPNTERTPPGRPPDAKTPDAHASDANTPAGRNAAPTPAHP